MDLTALAAALSDEPFDAEAVEASEDAPPHVRVALPIDDVDPAIELQVSLIASDDDSGVDLVQIFGGVADVDVDDVEVYDVVDAINLVSPGGTLHVLDDHGVVVLRNIILVPRGSEVAIDLTVQAIWLATFVIEGALGDLPGSPIS